MSKKFFTDIKNIRTAIDTNKLVVFAGAGISIDAGIPGWRVLIDEMQSEVDIPKNEQDYLRIAQMYFNDRQQKEFIDKIRSVLKHKKIKYNEIHEAIFKLTPEHILTTNFDDLLEQVIKKESLPFSVVSKDQEFPYALNTHLLVKVHGDLDDTDIVLKEDDFIDYSINHPLIEAFLKSVFASKVVLFVGYAFSDIDLKMIIQTVRNILGKDFQNAYLISVDDLHPTQREYLKNKGINVVNYFDAVNGDGKNYITEYLKGNNALNEDYYKKGENLSEMGQNLLNFLRFISSYDKFNEPLTEKNLIDQIYLSLNRFSEFKSLPPDFVANLYPFNISSQYVHNYERYSLITKNHKLYDLFFDQIEYENEEVKFKPAADMNLSVAQINEFENKLRTIISTLNYSLIYYFFKENEKPDSFGNYGWSDKYKKLIVKPANKCNCYNCRLSRFELDSVLIDSHNSTIDETTSIQSDLELAYANYKIGNFNQSLKLFGEVANKAWQSGKYFSYYIAKHNIKTLHNLMRGYERTLTQEELTKLLKELKNIDFDKLLFQIPFMGKSEYELLKIIRDDDVLNNAEKQIDDVLNKIIEAHDKYKDGRTTIHSQDYYQAIELELHKIISFYTNNYIVSDEYTNFTNVCKKGVEALLISFASNDDYRNKLKEFNKLFFDVAVTYCDAKEIKTISEKYQINKLTFNEKSIPEIIESVNNFLKSFFETSKFWGSSTFSNKTTIAQSNNDFFADKCRKKFSNIFLILSGVELSKEMAKDLIPNLLAFIQHETILHRHQITYLSAFICNNPKLFSKADFENLLKSILAKLNIYNDGSLLRNIAFAYNENKFSGISDKDLIFKYLSLSNSGKRYDEDTMIYLWSIADDEIKVELRQKIIDSLNKEFDSDFYALASLKKIIDYNDYFEIYLNEINNTKGSGNYKLNVGRPNLDSVVFINAVYFIYRMGVKGDDNRLNIFTNLSDYMKFYLNPEDFDYTKFKVEWLYIGERDEFYQRFKNIPAIKKAIEQELKINFNAELAEVYSKHFVN